VSIISVSREIILSLLINLLLPPIPLDIDICSKCVGVNILRETCVAHSSLRNNVIHDHARAPARGFSSSFEQLGVRILPRVSNSE